MKTTIHTLATGLGLVAALTLVGPQDLTNAGAALPGTPGLTLSVSKRGLANQRGPQPSTGARCPAGLTSGLSYLSIDTVRTLLRQMYYKLEVHFQPRLLAKLLQLEQAGGQGSAPNGEYISMRCRRMPGADLYG